MLFSLGLEYSSNNYDWTIRAFGAKDLKNIYKLCFYILGNVGKELNQLISIMNNEADSERLAEEEEVHNVASSPK